MVSFAEELTLAQVASSPAHEFDLMVLLVILSGVASAARLLCSAFFGRYVDTSGLFKIAPQIGSAESAEYINPRLLLSAPVPGEEIFGMKRTLHCLSVLVGCCASLPCSALLGTTCQVVLGGFARHCLRTEQCG